MVRSKQSLEAKHMFRDMLKRDVAVMVERFITDQPNQVEMINNAKDPEKIAKKPHTAEQHADALTNRILERTFHPSQIMAIRLKQLLWRKLNEIRKENKDIGFLWTPEIIKEKAAEITEEIFGELRSEVTDLANSKVKANTKLDEDAVQDVQEEMVSHTADYDNVEDFGDYLESEFRSRFHRKGNEPGFSEDQPASESFEALIETKTTLLSGAADIHAVWVDFDGAKRPQGIMFSMYGELLMEDIREGFGKLIDTDKKVVNKLVTDFHVIDVLIHALTNLLQENHLEDKEKLEELMTHLKSRRKNILRDLVGFRNKIEHRRKEDGTGQVYLSKEVRFMPRLDQKFVRAVAKQKKGEELTEKEKGYVSTFEGIKAQIKDINEIAQHNNVYSSDRFDGPIILVDQGQPVVPQVMLANTGARDKEGGKESGDTGFEDISIVLDEIDEDSDTYAVPLFESEATTSRKAIKTFLNRMWTKFDGDKDKFSKRVKEIFFAGSDLSKEIGSFAALIRVRQAAVEIEKFNNEHGTDVRVKLGSGESMFRQLGYLDSDAGLPLMSDIVLNPPDDLSDAEKQEIEDFRLLLQKKFGDNWKEELMRNPSGFHFMLDRHPFINGFTMQSRARDLAFGMEPSRFVGSIDTLMSQHKSIFDDRVNSFAEIPGYLKGAARASKSAYQELMGSPDKSKKPGDKPLLSLPALIEVMIKSPSLRDRALSREKDKRNLLGEIDHLSKSGIDARAIGTTTASNLIFPLGLLDKVAVLDYGVETGYLNEILHYLPVKDMLREMKNYEVVCEEIFEIMQVNGFEEVAEQLRDLWGKLVEYRQVLQEEFCRNNLPEEVRFNYEEGHQFVANLAPDVRELLDDDFESEKTQLYRKNFLNAKPILAKAMDHMRGLHEINELIKEAVSEIHVDDSNGTREEIRQRVFEQLNFKEEVEEGKSVDISKISEDIRERLHAECNRNDYIFKLDDEEQEQWNEVLLICGYVLGRLG